eukprot:jgi/Antlo1/1494/534
MPINKTNRHPVMKRPNALRNITNQPEIKKADSHMYEHTETCNSSGKSAPKPAFLLYSEYSESSISYLRQLELRILPDPNYMAHQTELQWSMRAILIDWLIEIHWKLGLVPETLFFTINIIDRFLSHRTVSPDKLQLVGITALFISSKYEEVECPSIETFSMISRNTLSEEDIRKAEKYMLYVLQCFVEFPSPITFLRVCSGADRDDRRVHYTAQYILERMYLDEAFLKYPGSLKACCAAYLAKKIWKKRRMIEAVPELVGYRMDDLRSCLVDLGEALSIPNIHRSVTEKYSSISPCDVLSQVASFFEKK